MQKHKYMNRQLRTYIFAVFVLLLSALTSCSSKQNEELSKLQDIKQRGTLLVGTTGDYRPLSYLEPSTNQYWGFYTDLTMMIAEEMGVNVQFVPTSWPTLKDDMLNETLFDIAICGISITDDRLAAPLINEPFTHGMIGVLLRKGYDDVLQLVNNVIDSCKADGTLKKLHEQYGLVYDF